jgi:hypothetical protein
MLTTILTVAMLAQAPAPPPPLVKAQPQVPAKHAPMPQVIPPKSLPTPQAPSKVTPVPQAPVVMMAYPVYAIAYQCQVITVRRGFHPFAGFHPFRRWFGQSRCG